MEQQDSFKVRTVARVCPGSLDADWAMASVSRPLSMTPEIWSSCRQVAIVRTRTRRSASAIRLAFPGSSRPVAGSKTAVSARPLLAGKKYDFAPHHSECRVAAPLYTHMS